MIRLCEIIGLTYNDLIEITGYGVWLIGFGVLIGICMHDIFETVTDYLYFAVAYLCKSVWKRIRKHFPNVRKK